MTIYEKLTADLIAAKEHAAKFANNEDGGACNFDSAAIYLPRWNRAKTAEAFEKAGLRFSEWNFLGTKYYLILGCYSGQGDRRTDMAEAVCDYLKNLGYKTEMYYQMD
jgi:hypothetical protein